MRLLENEKKEVATVAARWKKQYHSGNEWGNCMGGSAKTVYEKLADMPPNATGADVAAIIGNDSWVGDDCNECGKHTAVILVGDEPDYESATVLLCVDCARKIALLAEQIEPLAKAEP